MNVRQKSSILVFIGFSCLVLLIGCSAASTTTLPTKPVTTPAKQPSVKDTSYIGKLSNPNAENIVRDGGASVRLDGQILWTFGDSLFPGKSVDGANFRSNSAALANPNNPTQLSEPLDTNNAPKAFLQFTPQEKNYNDASGRTDDRFALWPTALVPLSDTKAYVIYNRLKVQAGQLNYEAVSTGIAEVSSGSTTVGSIITQRITELFNVPETQFNHAAFISNGMLYLYGCEVKQLVGMCGVARALLNTSTQRSAYTFWNGNSWTSDITQTSLSVEGSTTGFSVAWNSYLNAYVSIYSEAFSNKVIMRTAPEPQGPWSEATLVLTADDAIYATTQHASLEEENGRILFVSYYLPETALKGDLRLHSVELQ